MLGWMVGGLGWLARLAGGEGCQHVAMYWRRVRRGLVSMASTRGNQQRASVGRVKGGWPRPVLVLDQRRRGSRDCDGRARDEGTGPRDFWGGIIGGWYWANV